MPYDQIKRIFKHLAGEFPEIRLAYLFGSRLEKNVGPLSDYDFAVLLSRTASAPELCPRLSSLLSEKLDSRHVDVVCLNEAPVELAFSVISNKGLIYARDTQIRVEYEANTMSRYFDYLPVLRAFRRDILDGGDYGARVQRYREAFRRTQRSLGKIRDAQA